MLQDVSWLPILYSGSYSVHPWCKLPLITIYKGQEHAEDAKCRSNWTYGGFRGLSQHVTLTTRSSSLFAGIHRVCLCACACICVKMWAYWQHVSVCQGTLAPADEEIMSESPPTVTSCPPTPGVFPTSLSYWLLVILIHFHLCVPVFLSVCGDTVLQVRSLLYSPRWDRFFFFPRLGS